MSKRGSKESLVTPDLGNEDGSPPGTAVDFIFRTMIARASAPGKRQIRPKNVDALLNADIQEFGSDEDPDFDVSKDKHHDESDVSIESDTDHESGKIEDDDGKGSMDGNVEDSDDDDDVSYNAKNDPLNTLGTSDEGSDEDESDDSDEESSEEDDDTDSQSPVQKRSALRETLQKLNESEFAPMKNRKRKRPRKAGTASTNPKKGTGGKKDEASNKKTPKPKTKKDTGNKKPVVRKSGAAKKKISEQDDRSKSKDKMKAKRKKKSDVTDLHRTITDMVLNVEKSQNENRKETIVGSPICSACLGKSSDEMNEIVECDSCGITVHEACYGVSDTLSVSSGTGSSCSTEPWFCDACKTGAKNISCELCPMQGGLFKETTSGRWIHLVCALYTPGVIITDTGLPSLFEIPYAKWGNHPCSLCDDSRFARSGICIPCDAGMCKTYLHATCAQKHGLLSDPIPQVPPGMEMEADPYYAACKLHTNRETSKRRSKCFAILQEQLRIKQQQKISIDISPRERLNQSRIRRKLERIRFKVAIKQAHTYTEPMSKHNSSSAPLTVNNVATMSNLHLLPPLPTLADTLPPSWKEGNKKSRILPTSAGTAMAFLRKATLMGLDVKALELEDKHSRIVASVKKKWNIPPSLSVEYGAYYADRENRIDGLSEQCEKFEKENHRLNFEQIELQNEYDKQSVHNQLMDEDTDEMRANLMGITEVLKTLCSPSNKKLLTSIQGLETKSDLQGQRRRSPSYSNRRLSPPKAAGSKKLKKSSSISSPTPTSAERLAMKVCSVCDGSDEQPWIIRCDNCKKLYHMKCLDPPLTRMPKRSKLCGWMCSDCGEEELDAEEAEIVDTEAPRTLRGRTQIRKPGKYRHSTDSREGDLKIVCETPDLSSTVMIKSDLASPKPIKLELSTLSSPTAQINGNMKAPKKRKSGNSPTTSPDSLLSPVSLSESRIAVSTPKKPRKTKQKPTNDVQHESNVSITKPKKPRVRKQKNTPSEGLVPPGLGQLDGIVLDAGTSIVNAGVAGDTTPQKKKTPKAPKVKAEKKPPTPKVPKTPQDGPKIRKKKMALVDSSAAPSVDTTTGLAHNARETPVSVKKKRTKKSETKAPKQGELGNIPLRKRKKTKKTLAELHQIMMVCANVAVKKGDEAPAVVLTNGIPKVTKRRKFLITSGGNAAASTTTQKDKSIPPKKRSRVTAPLTAEEETHQDDIINAVASGAFDASSVYDGGQKNGISKSSLPDGVLMQGMAPVKSGWNNNTDADEHSIMKGHAMGSSCSGSDVITVNASDLIDCVLNTTSATTTASVSSYSPGFYSNSSVTNSHPVSISTNLASSSNFISNPTSTATEGEAVTNSQVWGQDPATTQDSQNVIKLIYESSDMITTTASLLSSPKMATNYTPPPPPPVVPPPPTLSPFNNTSSNSVSVSSEHNGICFTCSKEELKKNMVTCDKCAQDYHFLCLTPPLMYSPRRRNYSWFCSTCEEAEKPPVQPNQTQKLLEIPPQSENAQSAPLLPEQARFTVRLFEDDRMKNYMKKFQ